MPTIVNRYRPPSKTPHRFELSPEQERRRRISVQEAAALKGVSRDTFLRHFRHLVEKTSPRRLTVRLGDVLD
jgi:Fic family protein